MEKRDGQRIKRRLTCEFFHGNSTHRGIILDLSPAGVFIRTNAVLAPGSEIDIHLAASVNAPAMTLRGTVVRRRSVPATLTTVIQPGLGVKILDAPREFGLLTSDCEFDEAIQTNSSAASTQGVDAQQQVKASPATSRANANPDKVESPSQPTPEASPAKASPKTGMAENKSAKPDPKESKRDTGPGKRIEKSKQQRALIAVLVGGPVLSEIAQMLREMGAEVIECGPYDPQLAALDDARLLVVSAAVAMSDPIPVDTDMLVGLAVCGDISETMRSQIRQQGFRYLLRPHVHPEALRMLLRYALYAERDRRGRVRHAVGCEVSWRVGWRKSQGRLLDISKGGCCLLVEREPKVGASVAIKIPAEATGAQALRLKGEVLRSTPNVAHTGKQRTALGIILKEITPATRKTLDELCEKWNESPPMLPRGERPKPGTAENKELGEKSSTAKAQPVSPNAPPTGAPVTRERVSVPGPTPPPQPPEPDRPTRRGVFEQEIVQVDQEARVVQALLGRDLSIEGIRVVRQLGLDPGNKLRLALFDASQKEPLMLDAEVMRDDGGSGLFLRFVDLSPATTARVEEIVSGLPAVESIDPHGDAGVVPTSVISNEPR